MWTPDQPFQPEGVSGYLGMGFKVNSNFGTANWLDTYATDFRLYQGFSVCTATVDNKRDGVLALGVDYTNDPRFKIAFPGSTRSISFCIFHSSSLAYFCY